MKRLSLYFTAPYTVEVVETAVPQPNAGQLLVQTICSGISPGTEMLMYRGLFPHDLPADSTIESLSKPLQYPFQYGYASVGRVIACGQAVDQAWLGQRVFAFHPHESHFLTYPQTLFAIPDEIPSEQAVFLPNMETAVSFVMDAQPMIGEQVVLFGQGIVGLLTTRLLAHFPLGQLLTVDGFALRRHWSQQFGATASLDPQEQPQLNQLLNGEYAGADLQFELSGNPQALDAAIQMAGYNGRIIVGSWYGQKSATLDLGGAFHRKKLQIISSQVSEIAPQWNGRWSKKRRFDIVWEQLRRHALEPLITHRIPFTQAHEAYDLIANQPETTIKLLLSY
jgi:2-desacetyl-2-hydroxyethyl bacteriochlorophyllide A dehydrogenase